MSATLDHAFLAACRRGLEEFEPFVVDGRVHAVVGTVIEAAGLHGAPIGSVCRIQAHDDEQRVMAEVVGFREGRFLLMPLDAHHGVGPAARIRLDRGRATVPAGPACLGRVLNGLGEPIDGGVPLLRSERVPLYRPPEPALRRRRIRASLDVGVRAINAFTTVGRGARLGIFAGSGVGKSTVLGQIARNTAADVIVIGLVGERGREVRDFLERDLGSALARSVVVVSTSDEAPLLRVRAAHAATAIAESFRERGAHVLLLMDSLTRFCMAMREIGLAAGEPPATRGYTPSVWSVLPRLLERAGPGAGNGSVTGLYTVLVEGDDPNEPVADAARSMLDGHVALSRELAERGHYPAIDVLASVSRVMPDVTSPEHRGLATRAREALAVYRHAEDLIAVGAYAAGSDPAIDRARRVEPALRRFLAQGVEEASSLEESVRGLAAALGEGAA